MPRVVGFLCAEHFWVQLVWGTIVVVIEVCCIEKKSSLALESSRAHL